MNELNIKSIHDLSAEEFVFFSIEAQSADDGVSDEVREAGLKAALDELKKCNDEHKALCVGFAEMLNYSRVKA